MSVALHNAIVKRATAKFEARKEAIEKAYAEEAAKVEAPAEADEVKENENEN